MISPQSGSGSWLQFKIIQNLIILFIRYPPARLPGWCCQSAEQN